MKHRKFFGVTLSFVMVLSITSSIEFVAGRTSYIIAPRWNFCETERQLQRNICNFISTLSTLRGWNRTFLMDNNVTAVRLIGAAGGGTDDYCITFYTGHGGYTSIENGLHWLITDYYGNPVYDYYLYWVQEGTTKNSFFFGHAIRGKSAEASMITRHMALTECLSLGCVEAEMIWVSMDI